MPTYEVTVRGGTQLGELGALDLPAAADLAPKEIDADTPDGAARLAIAGLSPKTSAMLVYVSDSGGGTIVFWPAGDPVTFSRRASAGVEEGYCFIQAAGEECVGRSAPEGQTAVFADRAADSGWTCDACAVLVAPGV